MRSSCARSGRIHSPAETQRAAEELHAAGLANFNIDLMYGAARTGQRRSAGRHRCGARAFAGARVPLPTHTRGGTVFAAHPPALPQRGSHRAHPRARARRGSPPRTSRATRFQPTRAAGPNAAHNLNYWSFGDYLGVGAGAHGKISLGRARADHADAHNGASRDATWQVSPRPQPRAAVAAADLPFEFMLNALRLVDGFAIESLRGAHRACPGVRLRGRLHALCERGLLEVGRRRCRPSARGFAFLNDVLVEFLAEKRLSAELSALSTAILRPTAATSGGLYAQRRAGVSHK